jgi:hypothetical protein
MSWMRFVILVLIAFAAFAYSGPAQPLVWALATVVVAQNVVVGVLNHQKAREGPTHTQLVVETHPGPLLISYGTLGDVLQERFRNKELEEQPRSTEQWRFIFLGPPGTGDTIVWSARHKAMLSDKCLIFERLWQEMLKGETDSKREPHLVFELANDLERGHKVYRMYLKPQGRDVKPTVLAFFPVALLKKLKPEERQEVAGLFELRTVGQDWDVTEDDFGNPDIYYDGGEPHDMYENDLFKFKVLHYWSGA